MLIEMKPLKSWSIMMLMLMAMTLMVACGGDDGDGNPTQSLANKLSDTWKFTGINAQYGTSIASGWTPGVNNEIHTGNDPTV